MAHIQWHIPTSDDIRFSNQARATGGHPHLIDHGHRQHRSVVGWLVTPLPSPNSLVSSIIICLSSHLIVFLCTWFSFFPCLFIPSCHMHLYSFVPSPFIQCELPLSYHDLGYSCSFFSDSFIRTELLSGMG